MNELYYGDNLEILRQMPDNFVDLIYIDPPFNSKRNYNIVFNDAIAEEKAFSDTWSWEGVAREYELIEKEPQRYSKIIDFLAGMKKLLGQNDSLFCYLTMMSTRLVELHRVLKKTGSFYLHCDPTASHYLKILLDKVFGQKNFRNEIVWCYRRYTAASNRFQRLHDIVLFYSKSENMFFNQLHIPYGEKSGKMDSHYKQDKNGKWYRLQKRKNQEPYKVYLNEGVRLGDWWDIPPINASAKERLGYPTQKPEALLDRIIKASSNEGDFVLDAFCGCGTTIATAEKLNRRWIGIDITFLAVDLIKKRLIDHFYKTEKRFREKVKVFGIPQDLKSAEHLAKMTDKLRKEFEKWVCSLVGGVFNEKHGADGGIDGYVLYKEAYKKGFSKCYLQVKSGNVGLKEIQRFSRVIDSFDGKMGIFLTLKKPTKPMLDEIAKLPPYKLEHFGSFPKIQILTIEELLDGKRPRIPSQIRIEKKAKTINKVEQLTTNYK